MPRFVAFLRALNVGGHVVKMDARKKQFEAIGFADVETFIASGNVVFSSKAVPGLDTKIAARLERELGYEVRAFVRKAVELASVAAHMPFAKKSVAACPTYLVGFLARELDAEASKRLEALTTVDDRFHVRGRDFWWLSRHRQNDPAITGRALEKALGQPTTLRNVNTIRRMAERYGSAKRTI